MSRSSVITVFEKISKWLSEHTEPFTYALSGSTLPRRSRLRFALYCGIIFLTAFGVRLLHWQDLRHEIERQDTLLTGLVKHYQREADRMLEEGILFPDRLPDPGDARRLVHPPGYSILTMAVQGHSDNVTSYTRIRLLHVALDAVAVLLIFLIAAELLPLGVALLGGLLAALSPHLAYYALWLSPDNLAALPILLAVFLLTRAVKRPRLLYLIAAGVCLGLSCWLRSNALLLAPFLALCVPLLFERGRRLRYAAALFGAAILTFAPITVNNYAAYGRFIPLSLGAGITMIEGIADFDPEGRFGMPLDDKIAAYKDAEWHGREDYAGNLWAPDGIERDRYRMARGLAVIRDHPAWFVGVMARRAGFMLRYNDPGTFAWPFNTAVVPVVSGQPTYGGAFAAGDGQQPIWSQTPDALASGGAALSAAASPQLILDRQMLQVVGDESAYGDQFASPPIVVRPGTDYLLRLPVRLEQGPMAVKVTTADRRAALTSAFIPEPPRQKRRKKGQTANQDEPAEPPAAVVLQLPFASGDAREVFLVVSNNGASAGRPSAQFGQAEVFEMGRTPYQWTRLPRAVIRGVQKNLYTTPRLLPLVLIGVALLALARRWRVLALLLAVPLYYMCVQSALHTEYRYILGMHYFLFVLAGLALCCFGAAGYQALTYRKVKGTAGSASPP